MVLTAPTYALPHSINETEDYTNLSSELFIGIKNPNSHTHVLCDIGDASDASTVASSSQIYTSSSPFTEYSDFSPTHSLSIDSNETVEEPTRVAGSYIIYLEPDRKSRFAQALDESRIYLKDNYPGQDDSFLYPFHITLTSFFDVEVPERFPPGDFQHSSSIISLESDWKFPNLTGRFSEERDDSCHDSILSRSESNLFWPSSPLHSFESFRFEHKHEDLATSDTSTTPDLILPGDTNVNSLVEERLMTAVQSFIGTHVVSKGEELEKGVIELDLPAFEFVAAKEPLSIETGRIIIPWDLEWLTDEVESASPRKIGQEAQTGMLHTLCTEIEELLKSGIISFSPIRTRDHKTRGTQKVCEGIPRKQRMHTTLLNRQDLSLEEHEEVLAYFQQTLGAQDESVTWNLSVKQLMTWGCSKRGVSHGFKDVLSVKNFACSRTH